MSLSKRLELIRKSIKVEAVDIPSSSDNSEDPRRIRNFEQVPSINNDALREQFLNKTISAQSAFGALSGKGDTRNIKHETTQIAGVYNRAEDINARLQGSLNKPSFYAHIPENLNHSVTSSRHESPLVLNNNNSMFNFQATSENVHDVMINSNPLRDIPYKVRSTANSIGGNLELIKQALKEEKMKRKIPPPPPAFSEPKFRKIEDIQPSTSKDNQRNDQVVQKEMRDKCVETTVNTGNLSFEITSKELQDLSEDKKVILLEFMKAFNIRDSREVKAIRERLKHRLASQENKRKEYQSLHGSYPRTFGPPI